jgi:hypothetical protein
MEVLMNRSAIVRRMSTWWRKTSAVPDPVPAALSTPRAKPRVPPEYLSLHDYLEHRYASTVVLTFGQMEALLGFSLPESARTQREWWTGLPVPRDVHAHAWSVAGRTATPNLSAQTVAFERVP